MWLQIIAYSKYSQQRGMVSHKHNNFFSIFLRIILVNLAIFFGSGLDFHIYSKHLIVNFELQLETLLEMFCLFFFILNYELCHKEIYLQNQDKINCFSRNNRIKCFYAHSYFYNLNKKYKRKWVKFDTILAEKWSYFIWY